MSPPPSPSPPDDIPAALRNSPDYEVIRQLGFGGMGVVYLVRNRRMRRLEALKVVKKSLLEDEKSLKRFQREIDAVAQLSHPNIVAAYSAPQFDELLAFAMEYVEGTDLAELVKQQGRLPIADACQYIQQVASGLQHAAEKLVYHRDIKPSNLILTRNQNEPLVKILDFGLAKASSENYSDPNLTGSGTLGTPHYMAPEQIKNAAKADSRADIYSLGCTLFYLLTGAAPFSDERNNFDILAAHIFREVPPMRNTRSDVPIELEEIVAQMMAKSPEDRFQSPEQVAKNLAQFCLVGVHSSSAPEWPVVETGAWDVETPLLEIRFQDEVESDAAPLQNAVQVVGSRRVLVSDGNFAGGRLVVNWNELQFGFRWCPATSRGFQMGSPPTEIGRDSNEYPVEVTLSHGFWMLETPVTQEMWQGRHGQRGTVDRESAGAKQIPASGMPWIAAKEFCQFLTAQFRQEMEMSENWILDLPTEAQWEYACRAGSQTRYFFGDDDKQLGEYAWYAANSKSALQPVGVKNHDMHGLIWEWANDWYEIRLQGGNDPAGPISGTGRLVRGGSYLNNVSSCRTAKRNGLVPTWSRSGLGFRVIAVPVR
ncbi:MAG: bifunctional serine/threonine-protein kinase/formylglycine-generating enzyme family protein [Planctomycetota bacterium]|nr:bifunctional serine/threonine-protein kinase/formylglycine-generating enzyme family protein [Planctomycetota bacterium]